MNHADQPSTEAALLEQALYGLGDITLDTNKVLPTLPKSDVAPISHQMGLDEVADFIADISAGDLLGERTAVFNYQIKIFEGGATVRLSGNAAHPDWAAEVARIKSIIQRKSNGKMSVVIADDTLKHPHVIVLA